MPSFKIEREIVNNSASLDLVVIHKGGLRYIIPKKKEANFDKDQFIVISFTNLMIREIEVDPSQALTRLDKEILEKLQTKLNELRNQPNHYPDFPVRVDISVKLMAHQANDRGAIHSEMMGLTFYSGRGNIDKAPMNVPSSSLADALNQVHNNNMRTSVSYCAYVVDPQVTQKPFYVNVMGRATEVPVAVDEQATPGLYIGISIGDRPLETAFYSFDNLSKDRLEGLGVFSSKAEAMANGNTERYLEAEKTVSELTKVLANKNKLLEDTTGRLEQSEKQVEKLDNHITHLKQSHSFEVVKLKQDIKAAQDKHARDDYSNKERMDRLKDDANQRESRYKHTIDQMKQKSRMSFVVEMLKGLGAISGLIFAGIRLFAT